MTRMGREGPAPAACRDFRDREVVDGVGEVVVKGC